MAKCIERAESYCLSYPRCDGCGAYREPTNADRIRAMSDEALENGIRAVALGYEPWCDHHCKMCGDDNCNSCLAKWLKQACEGR